MPEEISISSDLDDLLVLAFEHAFESIEDGEPLTPFAVIERGDERTFNRFVAERVEEGLQAGRNALRQFSPKPDRAVIVFDGYLRSTSSDDAADSDNEPADEDRTDAIFVEAFENGQDKTYRFVIPYKPADDDGPLEPLDDAPMVFDVCDPLF